MTSLASFAELLPLVYTHRVNLKLVDLHLGRVYDLLGYDRNHQTLLTWNASASLLNWVSFEPGRFQFVSEGSPVLAQALAGEHPADFAARFDAVFKALSTTIFTAQGQEVKVIAHHTNLAGDPVQLSPWVVIEYACDGHRETLYYSKDFRQINFLMLSAGQAQNTTHVRESLIARLLGPIPEGDAFHPAFIQRAFRDTWQSRL